MFLLLFAIYLSTIKHEDQQVNEDYNIHIAPAFQSFYVNLRDDNCNICIYLYILMLCIKDFKLGFCLVCINLWAYVATKC